MNNQDIELRLQNLINSDQILSKKVAVKTKRIYKKLHFLGKSTETINREIHDKNSDLLMLVRVLNENHEMLSALIELQTTLQPQLIRMRKKVMDLQNQQKKEEMLSPVDRFVYTKNAFKKCLLGVCTKIRYHEIKTNNRNTVTGYIEAKDKLIPFLSRVSKDMKQVDAELWANITYGSPHLSEWNELFANNNRSTI